MTSWWEVQGEVVLMHNSWQPCSLLTAVIPVACISLNPKPSILGSTTVPDNATINRNNTPPTLCCC